MKTVRRLVVAWLLAVAVLFCVAPPALADDPIDIDEALPSQSSSVWTVTFNRETGIPYPSSFSYNGRQLRRGTDYTSSNTPLEQLSNGGFRTTMTFTGIGEFEGTATRVLTVNPYRIRNGDFSITNLSTQMYTGEPIEPTFKLVATFDTYVANRNFGPAYYVATYQNNVGPGEAQVILSLRNGFSGIVTGTFQIIDATELNAAIEQANALLEEYAEPEGGAGTLPDGAQYLPDEDAEVLRGVVSDAQALLSGSTATQADIDAATATLTAAIETAQAAIVTNVVDRSALSEAIATFGEHVEDYPPSDDGRTESGSGRSFTEDEQFVLTQDYDAAQDAIDAANEVLAKTDASQDEVDAALAELQAAQSAFDAAVKTYHAILYVGIGTTAGGSYRLRGSDDLGDIREGMNISFGNGESFSATAKPDTGCEFVGWYKGVVGSDGFVTGHTDVLISSEATYTYAPIEDMSIQAVFERTTCTITFDPNGGEGSMDPVVVEYGSSYELPVCTFTAPKGKVFDRWDAGAAGATITVTGDVTLTAQWKDEVTLIPIYRMYNTKTSEHLWTKSKKEYESCGKGNYRDWRQENIAWYSPNLKAPSSYAQSTQGNYVYVWRLYDKGRTGDHIYLTYGAEMKTYLSNGWVVDKGAGFWTVKKGTTISGRKTIPIYRAYNPKLKRGKHHYTPSKVEYDSICKNHGWKPEGVKFYVIKK